jgi:hypothetical protein
MFRSLILPLVLGDVLRIKYCFTMRERELVQSTVGELPENVWENSVEFMSYGPEDGVITTILEGHIDRKTLFHTIVGIYPDEGMGIFEAVSISEDKEFADAEKIYPRILNMKIPQRMKNYKFPIDLDKAELLRSKFELKQMPFIALAFGENVSNKKSVIGLFFADGLNPQTALTALKDAVVQTKAQSN